MLLLLSTDSCECKRKASSTGVVPCCAKCELQLVVLCTLHCNSCSAIRSCTLCGRYCDYIMLAVYPHK
jgi:hypothetical protein